MSVAAYHSALPNRVRCRLLLRRFRVALIPVMALLVFASEIRAAMPKHPVPIVLDTDIGTDIDDAFALALVLDSPELDLRAVTTVSGDTQARARLAAKMLAVAGRHDVPVAAGRAGGVHDIAQARWADGFSSPELVSQSAVELMKTEIDKAHGAMVLVAIGPLTNVADLLRKYPAGKKKIRRIVLMGGSISHGYTPGSGATAEYNIADDAPAAQTVFSSGIPILMAPLDVTARLQLETPERQEIFTRSTPMASALEALYHLWGQPTPTLHDPMAIGLFLDPALCKTKPLAVKVDSRGMTLVEKNKPANAVVALSTDPAGFIRFYLDRVAGKAVTAEVLLPLERMLGPGGWQTRQGEAAVGLPAIFSSSETNLLAPGGSVQKPL